MKSSGSRFFYICTVFTCTLVLLFSSCITNKQSVQEKFLTSKNWLLLKTEQEAGDKWIAETADPCKADNIYQFLPNGTFAIKSGPIKCNVGDPDDLTGGTWKITSDGARLIAKVSASNRDLQILELTSTSMVLLLDRDGKKIKETYVH